MKKVKEWLIRFANWFDDTFGWFFTNGIKARIDRERKESNR